jgi:hypothetical protein
MLVTLPGKDEAEVVVLSLATGWACASKFVVGWLGVLKFIVVGAVAGQNTSKIPIVKHRTMAAPASRFHVSCSKIFTMKWCIE